MAYQRPGFLDLLGRPVTTPMVARGVPERARRGLIFFVRPPLLKLLERALQHSPDLAREAKLAVVVEQPGASSTGFVLTVSDPQGFLARAFGMRVPLDGGPPVGYAIVDSSGLVRYQTLDPGVVEHLAEVRTMLWATP